MYGSKSSPDFPCLLNRFHILEEESDFAFPAGIRDHSGQCCRVAFLELAANDDALERMF